MKRAPISEPIYAPQAAPDDATFCLPAVSLPPQLLFARWHGARVACCGSELMAIGGSARWHVGFI